MFFLIFIFFILFFFRINILYMLLSFEVLFFFIFVIILFNFWSMWLGFLLITISACEAVIGLSFFILFNQMGFGVYFKYF